MSNVGRNPIQKGLFDMKHFFIVNIVSGVGNGHVKLVQNIENFLREHNIDGVIHKTVGVLDAYSYVKHMCENFAQEHKRFYACGGDGTINEVASAIALVDNADVAIIPCGTGNDFIINFDGYDKDTTLLDLATSGSLLVDIMQVNDRYSVNICNVGLDAMVAYNMSRMKKIPFVKGKMAYYMSLLYSFITPMGINLEVEIDGERISKKEYLLMLVANGKRYGGSFLASPNSDLTDGKLFFCAVDKVPRFLIAKLMSIYKKGEHLSDIGIKKYFKMKECTNVTIKSQVPLPICCDGEFTLDKHINIKVIPQAIKVVVPRMENKIKQVMNLKETVFKA